ncbi:hypothetical protein ACTJJ7_16325 [Phyllobacterium sp. 22229]|uniref:hypothetical protein n=1 Tax=Phyllobacterium sp. 22229 TaxID=3453895 RepID=UPI003F84C08A
MKSSKSVVKAAGPSKVTSSIDTMRAEERRYRAEDAMRDLLRAEGHRKNPKLMSEVKKLAKEQQTKLAGLCGKAK